MTDLPTAPVESPGEADAVPDRLPFPVVGIGASAGGIAALQGLLQALPDSTGMAFVVVLHLSPSHESNADSILQRCTALPVVQVRCDTRIEADHVYVISPRHVLSMRGGGLQVAPSRPGAGPHLAIDLFFRSLAVDHGDRAIGIVLSGTGSDGTLGLARLKEQGGIGIAQQPADAEYGEMPRSAIQSGHVDLVLPVSQIPQQLMRLRDNARRIALPPAGPGRVAEAVGDDEAERALAEVIGLLAARTGHDFGQYKRATVLRRIERRMQVHLLADLPAYRDALRADDTETQALLGDMLISVTQFFRDPDAFAFLRESVLPALVADRQPPEPLRAWSVGCATGEEAYSVAMVLRDEMARQSSAAGLQVFATDIDNRAIAVGRRGRYPDAIQADVPPELLAVHFTAVPGGYRVGKSLRDAVLFATHNALRDPPFSRLDLVACRNVLIYLNRDVQSKLLEMVHASLRPGGILMLGSAESADGAGDLFDVVDTHHRVFRARAVARTRRLPALALPVGPARSPRPPASQPTRAEESSYALLHRRMLEDYAGASVVVDARGTLLHMSDDAGEFLRHAGGSPSHDLLAMVRPELRLELRAALLEAMRSGHAVQLRTSQLAEDADRVVVSVCPARGEDPPRHALVVFRRVEPGTAAAVESPAGADSGTSRRITLLEEELRATRATLQATMAQWDAATEDLHASNEELQAINEELRSTTEELETRSEELQSVNEELVTVNSELRAEVEETERANNDLGNFIVSSDLPMIFVDGALRIRRYTPQLESLFNVLPTDIGRSLLDLSHQLEYDAFGDDVAAVVRSLQPREYEVRSRHGLSYIVRIKPYLSPSRELEGAVVTFVDITSLRDAEDRIARGEDEMRLAAMQHSSDFAVIAMDVDGVITGWNSGAEAIFGWTLEEISGRPAHVLFVPEDVATGAPELELATARTVGRAEDNRWHLRCDGTRIYCSGVTTPVDVEGLHGFVKIARDMTLQQQTEQDRQRQLEQARVRRASAEAAVALKDEFLAVMSHELKHPLNLINVNAEILSRAAALDLRSSPQAARAMDTLKHAIRTQGRIIDDLLDLSRVRTGKLALDLVAVDLAALARSGVETASADVAATGLDIGFEGECGDDATVLVNADAARLNQILWNLLSNAIKFTPAGGTIRVRVSIDGAFGRLDVIDDGQGIEAAFLPRVFEMFGQARARASAAQGGLGIGLALVKQLVEHHRGQIEGASDGPGHGARFTVWIPLYARALALLPAQPESGTRGMVAGLRIMLVDDDPLTVDSLKILLEMEGGAVTGLTTGAAAIEHLRDHEVDLVLTDLGMPDVDGYQLLATVRAMPGRDALPVIALTGFGRPHDVRRADAAGFSAHIGKPIALPELWQRIREVTDVAPSPAP